MKVVKLERTNLGGLKLVPAHYGDKLELVTRGSGQFQDGDMVVPVSVAHDTKPDQPRKGVRFVRVRHLTDQEMLEWADKNGRLCQASVITEITEEGTVVFGEATEVRGNLIGPIHEIGRVSADLIVWTNTIIQTRQEGETAPKWIRPTDHAELGFSLGVGLGGGRYEIFGPVHPTGWKLIEDACLAFGEKCRQVREGGARQHEERQQKLLATFMEEHPEAKVWFQEEPTWQSVLQAAIKNKIARFVRTVKSGHYASFSKEMDFYDHIFAVKVGEEIIEFEGPSHVEYEHGDD